MAVQGTSKGDFDSNPFLPHDVTNVLPGHMFMQKCVGIVWTLTVCSSLCHVPSVDFVKWSSQGMLRMSPDAMNALFKPTIDSIIEHLRKYHHNLATWWGRAKNGD